MKIIQTIGLLPVLALALNLNGATNDVASFSGKVVDAQGNPVANAAVVCYEYPSRTGPGRMELEATQRATTDQQGAFQFPGFKGMGVVLATKPGFAPGWMTWYAAPQEPQTMALGAPSTLAGVVVDDAGRPVADADVWVSSALSKTRTEYGQPNFLFGKVTRELFSTRTSADGQFHFDNFPADAQAGISVKKAGQAMRPGAKSLRYDELPFHAGQEDITLTLDPAGTVTGRVVARGTGRPVTSAVVALQPAAQGMGYFVSDQETNLSTVDGTFQIRDVPAGSYKVTATSTNEPIADWVADPVPVTVAAGGTVSDLQIQTYEGGEVEVTVHGKSDHGPLGDAGVWVGDSEVGLSGSTGTNGVAYFRMPPGQYSVNVNKQDWSQAQTQATVSEGQTSQVTLELAPAFAVSGLVRDASGAAVAGASVGVFPNYFGGDPVTRADANGHYELHWQKPYWGGSVEQAFYLIARLPERKLAAMHEMDEATTNLDLTLDPGMSVSGIVQDPKGKAVTNAVAYVSIHFENSSFSISRQPVYADEQGRFSEEALPRGQRYGWSISARGYGGGQEEMDAADPKLDHYDFAPTILKVADRKLAGRVLGTTGAPVAGAQLWMNGDGQANDNAVSDADGRFAFDAVCEGPVSVSANYKGQYGSADGMGGDTNLVIRFNAANRAYMAGPTLTVKGDVSDPSGKPAVGASVVVTPSWGAAPNGKTDANGEYSVDWQPQPGMRGAKYFVIARDAGRNLAAIAAIETNQTRVSLQLGPGLSISGTVQDEKGAPLTSADINLNMMAGNMGGLVEYGRIKVNSDGTFTIPALPMGQSYTVHVTAKGYGSARKSAGKTQTQTNSIQLATIKLKPADLPLAGRVLGADNKPLAGAQVNINGNGQPNGNTRTDGAGHFKFKVCNGPIQINAWSPSGGARNNYGTSYARGGDTNVVVKMGVQPQGRPVVREILLKPRPWTVGALAAWPAEHKAGAIILLSLQGAVLLGTAGGVFWQTRRRRQHPS